MKPLILQENKLFFLFHLSKLIFLFVICVQAAIGQNLYFSDGRSGKISQYNLDNNSCKQIVSGLSNPYSIAYDARNETIYFSDRELDIIGKVLCNQTYDAIITENISEPRGLIIDSINNKLYWVDHDYPKIMKANLDGTGIETLEFDGLIEPHDITIDQTNNHIYWTDRKGKTISRADLDGQNHVFIIPASRNLTWPSGIDLDIENNHIYWTDTQDQAIYKCDFSGNNIERIYDENLITPFRIKIKSNRLYFTDWDRPILASIDLDGSGYTEIKNRNDGFPGIIGLDLGNAFFYDETKIDTTLYYTGCTGDNYEIIINNQVFNEASPFGTITLTNQNGCDSIVLINLEFHECESDCSFYVPNIISKSSVVNNKFKIFFNEECRLNQLEISIFNRWGEIIFKSADKDEFWNPHNLESGIFIYKINLTTSSESYEFINEVTVLD